jgi:hypothetical protein
MTDFLYGTGRIGEIIKGLQSKFNVIDVTSLPEEIKLNALLDSLQLNSSEFDCLIAENSPVFRTIKGHAFEAVFKYILTENKYEVVQLGGDNIVDLQVNNFSLQLKTPNMAGTNEKFVQYKTHKTHGAKSELESIDYYHDIGHFADFLVGLISYEPFVVIFLSQEEIPRHKLNNLKILSPFTIEWNGHIGINNFKRIGLDTINLTSLNHIPKDISSENLSKSSKKLNLKSEIIVDTILTDGNFRIWDMSIRGFAREVAIKNLLGKFDIQLLNPVPLRPLRGDKSDFAVKISNIYKFFQVKGVSTNNCRFSGQTSLVATETQLTRGRVNDHLTQSRLYLKTDFDYLILALDPPLVQMYDYEIGIKSQLQWKIFCIPTSELKEHLKITNRINSLQKIKYLDLLKYELNQELINKIFKP